MKSQIINQRRRISQQKRPLLWSIAFKPRKSPQLLLMPGHEKKTAMLTPNNQWYY